MIKQNYATRINELIVIDKYNSINEYKISKYSNKENLYKLLIKVCKNAKFGYTDENLKYLKNNVEKYECPECGKDITI